LTSWALSGSRRSVKFDGNGDARFEGATRATYSVLPARNRETTGFLCTGREKRWRYTQRKRNSSIFRYLYRHRATSEGGRQWVGGLKGLKASLPNAGTSDSSTDKEDGRLSDLHEAISLSNGCRSWPDLMWWVEACPPLWEACDRHVESWDTKQGTSTFGWVEAGS
jgi:hypothetical protein